MTQFGVAIVAEGTVAEGQRTLADVMAEAPEVGELKDGDLAIVRNIISRPRGAEPVLGEEVLAQYRDDHCTCDCNECEQSCCRWWAFFGTDFSSRADEVVVVRRVKVVDA